MGQLFEIMFFAALSAYIFYRLWSVMGQETDEDLDRRERGQRPLDRDDEEDNVISMSQKRRSSVVDTEDSDEAVLKVGAREGLKKLRQIEPQFVLKDFLTGSKAAYEMIIGAFSKGDIKTLQTLLTEKTYQQFKKAIEQQAADETVTKTSIERIDRADIDSIEVVDDSARITVRYHSRQIIVTQKANGDIIDNPAEISIPITDIWTFTRQLNNPSPIWLLMATSSESYRD